MGEMVASKIDGILGFSQGAVAASMIACMYASKGCCCSFCKGAPPPMPRFAIMCSAFAEPFPSNAEYPPDKVQVPSLHVWGEKDERIAGERAQMLSQTYEGALTHVHNYTQGSGHLIPQKADDCPRF